MSAPKEPFLVLSNEEFARLTTAGRADYIRRAVEALDILRAQMNAEALKSLRDPQRELLQGEVRLMD